MLNDVTGCLLTIVPVKALTRPALRIEYKICATGHYRTTNLLTPKARSTRCYGSVIYIEMHVLSRNTNAQSRTVIFTAKAKISAGVGMRNRT